MGEVPLYAEPLSGNRFPFPKSQNMMIIRLPNPGFMLSILRFGKRRFSRGSSGLCLFVGLRQTEPVRGLLCVVQRLQEYLTYKQTPPPQDPTVGLCQEF